MHQLAQDDERGGGIAVGGDCARGEAMEVVLDRFDGQRVQAGGECPDERIVRLQRLGCARANARDFVLDRGNRILDAEAGDGAPADGELGLADRGAFLADVELQQPPTRRALSLFCVSTSRSPMLAMAFTVPSIVSLVNFTWPVERRL